MKEPDRKLAELVLNRLMTGGVVTGWNYTDLDLKLKDPYYKHKRGFLNAKSGSFVFDSMPKQFPDAFEDQTEEEENFRKNALVAEEIQKVEILSPWPHLVVHFISGKILYINGEDQQYEPWTAGLYEFSRIEKEEDDEWLVAAYPGGDLEVFSPDGIRIKKVEELINYEL